MTGTDKPAAPGVCVPLPGLLRDRPSPHRHARLADSRPGAGPPVGGRRIMTAPRRLAGSGGASGPPDRPERAGLRPAMRRAGSSRQRYCAVPGRGPPQGRAATPARPPGTMRAGRSAAEIALPAPGDATRGTLASALFDTAWRFPARGRLPNPHLSSSRWRQPAYQLWRRLSSTNCRTSGGMGLPA